MRIKLLRGVVVKGFPNIKVGEPVDVPSSEAQVLIGMGVAELAGEEKAAAGYTTGRGAVETHDPEPATRDPEIEPKKRGRTVHP